MTLWSIYTQVYRAKKAGLIVKPDNCERCGAISKLQGHHNDYSKPLELEWLCPGCHRRAHGRNSEQPKNGEYPKYKSPKYFLRTRDWVVQFHLSGPKLKELRIANNLTIQQLIRLSRVRATEKQMAIIESRRKNIVHYHWVDQLKEIFKVRNEALEP